jgi:hypothetical protein
VWPGPGTGPVTRASGATVRSAGGCRATHSPQLLHDHAREDLAVRLQICRVGVTSCQTAAQPGPTQSAPAIRLWNSESHCLVPPSSRRHLARTRPASPRESDWPRSQRRSWELGVGANAPRQLSGVQKSCSRPTARISICKVSRTGRGSGRRPRQAISFESSEGASSQVRVPRCRNDERGSPRNARRRSRPCDSHCPPPVSPSS